MRVAQGYANSARLDTHNQIADLSEILLPSVNHHLRYQKTDASL